MCKCVRILVHFLVPGFLYMISGLGLLFIKWFLNVFPVYNIRYEYDIISHEPYHHDVIFLFLTDTFILLITLLSNSNSSAPFKRPLTDSKCVTRRYRSSSVTWGQSVSINWVVIWFLLVIICCNRAVHHEGLCYGGKFDSQFDGRDSWSVCRLLPVRLWRLDEVASHPVRWIAVGYVQSLAEGESDCAEECLRYDESRHCDRYDVIFRFSFLKIAPKKLVNFQ